MRSATRLFKPAEIYVYRIREGNGGGSRTPDEITFTTTAINETYVRFLGHVSYRYPDLTNLIFLRRNLNERLFRNNY